MKTSEFIEKALASEYVEQYEITDESILLLDKRNDPIATVSFTEVMGIDTRYWSFNCMDNSSKNEMLDLLCEYAETPIKERRDEKEYQLKNKLAIKGMYSYLVYYTKNKYLDYGLGGESSHAIKTAFTIQEWEVLTEQTWEDLLLQFKAIEV